MALIAGNGTLAPRILRYAPKPAPSSTPTSSPTPPPPPPTSIQDYLNALQNDPIYQSTMGNLNAQGVGDASSLASGVLGALVDRGVVPNLDSVAQKLGLSGDVVNWIKNHVNLDQATSLANQANSSGVSEQAKLDTAHAQSMQNIKDALAARGLVRSGATPFLTGQEEQNYKNANYQADKALSDYLNGAFSAFMGRENDRQTQGNSALTDAYNRALSLYGATPPGAGGPPPVTPTGAPVPSSTPGPNVSGFVRNGRAGGNLYAGRFNL